MYLGANRRPSIISNILNVTCGGNKWLKVSDFVIIQRDIMSLSYISLQVSLSLDLSLDLSLSLSLSTPIFKVHVAKLMPQTEAPPAQHYMTMHWRHLAKVVVSGLLLLSSLNTLILEKGSAS